MYQLLFFIFLFFSTSVS